LSIAQGAGASLRHHPKAQAFVQSQTDTNAKFAELAAAQKHTDEKLAALIDVVDSIVRRLPQQQ
jgi:hypothetical protein